MLRSHLGKRSLKDRSPCQSQRAKGCISIVNVIFSLKYLVDHTSRNHIQVVGASMCVVILDIRMCNMSASHLNTLCINLSILCSYHTISTPPNRPRLPNFIRRFDLSTPPGTGPVLCAANAAATVTNGNTVSTGVFYFKRFFVAL